MEAPGSEQISAQWFGYTQSCTTDQDHRLPSPIQEVPSSPQDSLGGMRMEQQPLPRGEESKEPAINIFVGDLSGDVDAEMLKWAFSSFQTVTGAKVVMDPKTGRSRGYGFVSFRDPGEAQDAIETMDGAFIGKRAIRVNRGHRGPALPLNKPQKPLIRKPTRNFDQPTYEEILASSPYHNATVYIGNIPLTMTDTELATLFQPYGFVHDVRIQLDRGFAFVSMDSHENAANAIYCINGQQLTPGGKRVKVSWGKERPPHPDALPPPLSIQVPIAAGGTAYPTPVATPAFFAPTETTWMYSQAVVPNAEGYAGADGQKDGIPVPAVTYQLISNPPSYFYAFPVPSV